MNLVDGNTAFAVDLYRELSISEGNLFYSPYSISLALAMAHAGARGEMERQMAETLGFRLPQERLHAAFNALDLAVIVPGDEGRRRRIRDEHSPLGLGTAGPPIPAGLPGHPGAELRR